MKWRERGALIRSGVLSALLLAAAGVSQAQTSGNPPPAVMASATSPVDESLTWHGITLYGIVDVAIQYDTHSAPFSDYFMANSADLVQKNSNNSVFGAASNNLSQSRVGLQGKEPLGFYDWSAVFKVETYFNPTTGTISDALKSLVQNNGKPLNQQGVNIDSSVAGEAFQQAFVGFSSPTYGTLTFGRQNTIMADGISKYDPLSASQAFSVIGLSGTAAGGGDTEDRRLDDSLKYVGKFDFLHVGLQYKLPNSSASSFATGGSGSAWTAFEVSVGADYAGFSVDGYYLKIKDAIAAAALSVVQYTDDLPKTSFSSSNALAGTVSDNETYSLMALYNMSQLLNMESGPTLYGAYEHIRFENPSIALAPGFHMIGGYVLAFPNNTAYVHGDKTLQVYWAGVKWPIIHNFDVMVAYYGYKQNSYATGKDAGCSSTVSGACSGNLNAASLVGDYHFTKRFDTFAGFMWSNVSHGLANGYLNTTNINPTIGVRFSF
jgi:predicted porin